MKTAERALSLLLSLMLVLGTVAVGGINAAADESLYEISSYADLKNFASLVNSGNTSACAKLMNDIECKNDDGTAAKDWTPIGNVSNNYIGTFDGDCHVITGLSNAEVTNVPSYAGLFGYVGSKTEGGVTTKGTVKNVGLKGGKINGTYYVGGVAGYNDGTVANCYNTGNVSGSNYVGGVVGNNGDTVTNCYNTGNVSGSKYVGGVAGQNYNNSSLKNCYNTGDVSGNNTVGGVVGQNLDSSTISNCYNTGDVSGNDSVGGVVGQNLDSSTISNCYNTGSVTAIGQFADAGGVVGYNFYNSSVENCCYDSDRAPGIPAIGRESSATHTSVEGLTTAQMTGANALDNMTFA
ncbi:MAG: hypothetical protein IKH13_01455, partial [Clostridia bacterium]|nr:hypothetical protein [Clostridia bacterium]